MQTIGVIINPYAKQVRKKRTHMEDFYNFNRPNVLIRITQNVQDVDEVIKELKKNNVAYIGIVGGDGTIHHILTRLIHIYAEAAVPPLIILKGGTMNLVSRSIHLNGSSIEILQRLLEAIDQQREITLYERDTLRIKNRYCFLFGIGVVTNYLKEVYRGEKGPLANLRGFLKAIEHSINEPEENSLFRGVHGEFFLDDNRLDFNYITAILAGTVEYISPGMPALYRARDESDKFHILITNLTKFDLLKQLYVAFGIPSHHKSMISMVINKLSIKAEAPFQYTMDGDIYEADCELNIILGPKIRFAHV